MSVHERLISEHRIKGKPLGRHVAHDPRSKEFPAEQATAVIDVAHRATGLPLDQGNRGSCTAQALCGALDSLPDYKGHALMEADANHLYDEEIVAEGYNPATDDPGGTGLYICRVGKHDGLLKSYRHAFSLEAALKALVLRPNIWGINWYEGFDNPDSNGVVKIAGSIRGGHEICALQIITERKLVGFVQSWGRWGVANPAIGLSTGAFFVTYDDLDRLLSEDGDCTVPYPL